MSLFFCVVRCVSAVDLLWSCPFVGCVAFFVCVIVRCCVPVAFGLLSISCLALSLCLVIVFCTVFFSVVRVLLCSFVFCSGMFPSFLCISFVLLRFCQLFDGSRFSFAYLLCCCVFVSCCLSCVVALPVSF